ncbi:hypothetical protein WICANDRAFT_60120 [Wickerhamomyces anomalus NRRL Y-366-8]|uniref:Dynein light chain n=1 Tax=Wickerhamomyces anomalus (strain ATCC 58044 / CBS 1984 / NCYC 433 / NRRL Y-366-8) TaxID=683960 RepID=A0A1E3P9I3_WICAA|nr:uncharacterized protein WICANDRAFT_60120 [Wickerhamomyces anomalus NRRL Y-366-8]ODQ62051.1 hypothetical protein WICANDRAFT_60120 [Wickerhamomyces anomalus NRRL Y-366-8]
MADNKPVLKAQDMAEDVQAAVFELAATALEKHTVEKDIATFLKKELDEKYGHTWHVIVGKNFGSYVTHEMGYFTYFYIGPLAFLIFKTG